MLPLEPASNEELTHALKLELRRHVDTDELVPGTLGRAPESQNAGRQTVKGIGNV